MDSSRYGKPFERPRDEQESKESSLSWHTGVDNLRKVETELLVRMCLRSERPAWEEFFKRFIPLIKRGIRQVLAREGNSFGQNELDETIEAIYEKVVVKLVRGGILNNCQTPHCIEPWLATVACNQACDWLRQQSRKKRLPEKAARRGTRSLEQVVDAETGCTLGDIIPAPPTSPPEGENPPASVGWLNDILQAISGMNPKKRWVLRLSLVSAIPLSPQDREELGRFSPLGREGCDECLRRMLADVCHKKKARAKAMGKAVLLWYELQNSEYRHAALEKACTDETRDELAQLSAKLTSLRTRRRQLLEEGNRLCLPAHAEIAAITGIPEDKVQQVSTYLRRARQTLAASCGPALPESMRGVL